MKNTFGDMFARVWGYDNLIDRWFRDFFSWVWRKISGSRFAWITVIIAVVYSTLRFTVESLRALFLFIHEVALHNFPGPVEGGLNIPSWGPTFASIFQFVNYVFPLAELSWFFVLQVDCVLGMMLYRLLKSWIPTLS